MNDIILLIIKFVSQLNPKLRVTKLFNVLINIKYSFILYGVRCIPCVSENLDCLPLLCPEITIKGKIFTNRYTI